MPDAPDQVIDGTFTGAVRLTSGPADTDSDGVSDEIEALGPNNGDSNADVS